VSRIVALGEEQHVAPFAMVGVAVIAVDEAIAVRNAWSGLGDDVGLVILTRTAANALGPALQTPGSPLWAVMS
jgi:vacuolar-type H+-ATPase subunit F/Vma7